MKKSVIFRGPVLTQSGYGVHARQVARWLLNKQDVDVKFQPVPWGGTPWILDINACDGLVGRIIEHTVEPGMKGDVSFQLLLPNEWDTTIAPINIGMTAGVETDRCNPDWIRCCNAMSRIIVPSQHVASCITSSGKLTVPLDVVPEAYTDAIATPSELLPLMPVFSTMFNFLVFGQITGNNPYSDRKNTFFTIKWLCEAFKDDPDVGIVIKTNAGRNTKNDRNIVKTMLTNVLGECRRGAFPKIHMLHGDMNDHEVASLYRHPQVKALVAATRGEGFGLPILEAAASGLPIIATDWSGHLDFLKLGKFVSLMYQLADVHPSRIDGKIFVKGARWANPSEDDFKKRVTKFRTSSMIPHEWAADLALQLSKSFGFEAVTKCYDTVLKDIL